jgi:hypothetical protein
LQIASATTKRGTPLPDRVIAVLTALYGEALKDGQPVIFSRIAQLSVEYKIIEAKQAATDLETAANTKPDIYPDAIRRKPPPLGSTSSRRWMVLASKPVASFMRLAARPVGAHNKRFMCFAEKIRRIELTVVVLPTPARR